MRLTLRTLLAHLDRTLDTEDDAAIAEKLRQSEFAAKLVQRVRTSLIDGQLSAPAPDATGTADDPNRIGEYLDSVLSAAQVAEVERICLESDAHLAEVAACHQILTLVLAKPAEISPALRQRIYQLDPSVDLESIATQGVFGDLPPASVAGFASDEAATVVGAPLAGGSAVSARSAVAPVGPDDSGVSDAPTRLKDATAATSAMASSRAGRGNRTAGGGSSRLTAADLADFAPRPIRVMPWLVSLALVAVFLFVAARAFDPLLKQRQADADAVVRPPAQASTTTPSRDSADTTPAPTTGSTGSTTGSATTSVVPSDPVAGSGGGTVPVVADSSPNGTADHLPERSSSEDSNASPPPVTNPPVAEPPVAEPPVAMPPKLADNNAEDRSGDSSMDNDATAASDPGRAGLDSLDSGDGQAEPVVVSSDQGLLLVRHPEVPVWEMAKTGDVIANGYDLICAPQFRDTLMLPGQVEVTLVGPARLNVQSLSGQSQSGQAVALTLAYGRLLIAGGDPDAEVQIRFDGTQSQLTLPDPASVTAIQVIATRLPGSDPEATGSSQRRLEVLATQGTPRWQTGNRPEVTLVSGQRLTVDPSHQVSINDAAETPAWIDPPQESKESMSALARSGLLSLLADQPTVEASLQEAVSFRRAEVAALAAQTLTLLDRYDVYFGTNGVFNQPRQRTYWGEHFDTLVSALDSGPTAAAAIRRAVEQMDGAQAAAIFRFLWLFSDQQLSNGGDEMLVKALDDSNMTIRVLAAENLRTITGSLQNYRADVELPARRANDVKRWEVKARRGEIRWAKP